MTANSVAREIEQSLLAELDATAVSVSGRATVGLSQETWFAEVERGSVQERVVVRLPTAGSGDRVIAVQRRSLQLASTAGLPVPDLVGWCDDAENAFGRPFLVMERVAGSVPWSWSAIGDRRLRQNLAEEAISLAARLHAFDFSDYPPEELPRSVPIAPAADRELETYTRRLGLLPGPVPAPMQLALQWLGEHLPSEPRPVAFLHNDFRMGNFLVEGARIVSVLDWELAGFGDPAADVIWCSLAVWDPVELDISSIHRAYERASGSALTEEVVRFYTVLGYLRNAYYALSGWTAFETGRMNDLRMAALRFELPVRLDRLVSAMAGRRIE